MGRNLAHRLSKRHERRLLTSVRAVVASEIRSVDELLRPGAGEVELHHEHVVLATECAVVGTGGRGKVGRVSLARERDHARATAVGLDYASGRAPLSVGI